MTNLVLRGTACQRRWAAPRSAGAESGDPGGQSNPGYFYETGQGGLSQSYAQALKWYRLAAEQGDENGQYNSGLLYFRGNGVPKNIREAEKWLKKAAERDMSAAQNDLGALYTVGGDGIQQDLVEAYKWLWIASQSGVARSNVLISQLESRMTKDQISAAKRSGREWMRAH